MPDYLSSISDNSEKVNHLHIPRQRNDEVTYCAVIVEDKLIKSMFTKISMKRKCSQGYIKWKKQYTRGTKLPQLCKVYMNKAIGIK